MGSKKPLKIEALVVKAIRRLQDAQGSSTREICSYISQEYGIPTSEIRKQVQLALKRGVTYGILQCLKGGFHTFNHDFVCGQTLAGGDGIPKIPCHRRRYRRSRKRSRRGRSAKRRRRSKRKSRSRRRTRLARTRKQRSQASELADIDAEVTEDPGNNIPVRKESASSMLSTSDDGNPEDPGDDPAATNPQEALE